MSSQFPEKIKLFTFYNSHFNVLKDRFLHTLKDDYDVHCVLCDFEANLQPIRYAQDMFIARGNMICNAIQDNIGHIIIVSDVDIQFFRPSEPLVRDMLQSYDLVFQKGDEDLNTTNMGFIGINCNQKTQAFWEEVLQRIKDTGQWEELIVNEMLQNNPRVDYSVFPETIWTPGHKSRPDDIILHHAIAAGVTPTGKLKQMEKVTQALKDGTFAQLKIKDHGDSLLSKLHYLKKQLKEKGAWATLTKILPRLLYNHFIDRNIGKIGIFIKKISPSLYTKLKRNAHTNS